MDVSYLTENQPYADFFRQSVLEDIPYWESYLKDKATDNARLKQKREQIVKNIQFSLDLETAWKPVQLLIEVFAPYMERWGYWKQWQETLEYALKVAHQLKDKASVVMLSILLARLSYQQGYFQKTVTNYHQAIHLARQIGDRFNEARACTNLGYYYAEKGYWWRAEILCCCALKLFEQVGSDYGCAHTENHLGVLYDLQGRQDEARQHLERACEMWQSIGDNHGIMRSFINLGALYNATKQPEPALQYLEKAIQHAESTGEEVALGMIYMNMGHTYILTGDYAKSEECSKQAETIFKRYTITTELARVWNNLGVACFYQGKSDEAGLYLEASLRQWRNLNNKRGEIDVLVDIIEYELTMNNRPQALGRLNELEGMLGQNNQQHTFNYLQPLIEKYRRSLIE